MKNSEYRNESILNDPDWNMTESVSAPGGGLREFYDRYAATHELYRRQAAILVDTDADFLVERFDYEGFIIAVMEYLTRSDEENDLRIDPVAVERPDIGFDLVLIHRLIFKSPHFENLLASGERTPAAECH